MKNQLIKTIAILTLMLLSESLIAQDGTYNRLYLKADWDQLRFEVPGENRYWIMSKTVGTNDKAFALYAPEDGGYFTYWRAASGDMIVNRGNVGIGVVAPLEKLHVGGNTLIGGQLYAKRSGTLGNKYNIDNAAAVIGDGNFNMLIDGNELFTNQALYIGSHPGHPTILGNISESGFNHQMYLHKDGDIGIGTQEPRAKLDVRGDFYLHGVDANQGSWKRTNFYYRGHSLVIGSKPGAYAHNKLELKPGGSSSGSTYSALEIFVSPDENVHERRVRITSLGDSYFNGGRIGIGTDNPTAKLHVNGNILASEVTVSTTANNFPDYVFKPDYNLISLEEVEAYVKANSHLPEVPSAEEVEANGHKLAEMNLLLLKKIEELTLYVIRQEKEIKAMKEQIENLNNK